MPFFLTFRPGLAAVSALGLVVALLTGCAAVGEASFPYKPDVVQGNFISQEQVAQLRPGQSRAQLRDLLGTPFVTSLFHSDRWDYVFTLKRLGAPPQAYKLSLYFKGDQLDRFEGDAMPSEMEFVRQLDARRSQAKAPTLEANEEALGRYPVAPASRAPAPSSPTTPPAATPAATYPPLESPGR